SGNRSIRLSVRISQRSLSGSAAAGTSRSWLDLKPTISSWAQSPSTSGRVSKGLSEQNSTFSRCSRDSSWGRLRRRLPLRLSTSRLSARAKTSGGSSVRSAHRSRRVMPASSPRRNCSSVCMSVASQQLQVQVARQVGGAEIRPQLLTGYPPGTAYQDLVDGDAEPALAEGRPGGAQVAGPVPAQLVQLAGGLRPGAGVEIAGQQAGQSLPGIALQGDLQAKVAFVVPVGRERRHRVQQAQAQALRATAQPCLDAWNAVAVVQHLAVFQRQARQQGQAEGR